MKATLTLLSAVLAVSTLAASPAAARHRHHHHRYHHHMAETFVFAGPGQPYSIRYTHNYGPGLQPGTFAYYDGPLSARCKQSAAAYRGQDGRAHPCN